MGRWGYVDTSGKIEINPQFDKADVFSEGLAAVRLGGGGLGPFPDDPQPLSPFHGGGGGRYGYINPDGKYVINPQFEDAGIFRRTRGGQDGRNGASLTRPGKLSSTRSLKGRSRFPKGWRRSGRAANGGSLTRPGKLIINPQFERAGSFVKGLAPVRQGKQWGFIDPTGKFVINPQFDDAAEFSDGLAPVSRKALGIH